MSDPGPSYPLRAFLDLSTSHLTPDTRDWLDERAHRSVVCSLGLHRWVAPTPCGWFVYADGKASSDHVPDDLLACMRKAREIGADYILFDSNASPAGPACELPLYAEDVDA